MLRQLLIIALISGVAITVPSVQAAKKEKGAEQADGKKKEKKPKKDAEGGDKEKKARPKPTDQSLTGTLSEGEAKGDKKTYVLATADGDLSIGGKKAEGLAEYVGKKITLNCKGVIVENKKGKSLMIAKLGDVAEAPAE